MSGLYKVIEKKVFPKQTVVDVFTQYYGEEYRKYIHCKIESVNLIFVAKDIVSFRVMDLFKKEALSNGYMMIEDDVNQFLQCALTLSSLEILKNNNEQYVCSDKVIQVMKTFEKLILKYPESIKAMGFDFSAMKKIEVVNNVEKDQWSAVKKFYDISDKKFEEFINYMSVSSKTYDKPEVADYKKISEDFNKCIELGVAARAKFDSKNDSIVVDVPDKQNEGLPLKKDVTYKLMNLEGKDEALLKEYISELMKVKSPFSNFDDHVLRYFIDAINYIFDTNFQTLSELNEDLGMRHFIYFIRTLDPAMRKMISSHNQDQILMKEFDAEEYKKAKKYFLNNPLANAAYNAAENAMRLPISKDLTTNTVLHEANHCLSRNLIGNIAGFKTTEKARALNEIINEFLTKQLTAKMTREQCERFSLKDVSGCGYDQAVEFMKPFLISFEEVLKECQMGMKREEAQKHTEFLEELSIDWFDVRKSSADMLIEYIGKNNFDYLVELTSRFANCSYGKFITKNEVITASDLVRMYELQDGELNASYQDVYNSNIEWLIELKQLLTNLTSAHEAVKRGEIDNIPDLTYSFGIKLSDV